jgi:hypothetical protein
MDDLADFLFAEYQQAGLTAWKPRPASSGVQVTSLLNVAWEEFEARPDTFAAFERQKIEEWKKVFGLLP